MMSSSTVLKRNRYIILYVLLFGLVVGVGGCKNKRPTTSRESKDSTFVSATAKEMVLNLEIGKETLQVKGRMEVIKDSLIYLSLQPFLGMEMYRLECTKEQLLIVDKTLHRYCAIKDKHIYAYVEDSILEHLLSLRAMKKKKDITFTLKNPIVDLNVTIQFTKVTYNEGATYQPLNLEKYNEVDFFSII